LAVLLLASKFKLLGITEVIQQQILQYVLPGICHLQAVVVRFILDGLFKLGNAVLPVDGDDDIIANVSKLGLLE
jgi:hypothetical protein